MEKRKQENVLLKYKDKLVMAVMILLVLTGSLIIYINVKPNPITQKIDPRANIYSCDDFESEEKVLEFPEDDSNYHHRDYDYSYCDYSDYDCSRDDYDCYFNRKRKCDEKNSEDESKVIYILNERDEDRYLIKEYKYGYTYRATDEYIKRHGEKIVIEYKSIIAEDNFDEDIDLERGNNGEYYYYEYNSFLKEDEKKVCYITPPADKLFYTKCPGY